MVAWLDALIGQTCTRLPTLVGDLPWGEPWQPALRWSVAIESLDGIDVRARTRRVAETHAAEGQLQGRIKASTSTRRKAAPINHARRLVRRATTGAAVVLVGLIAATSPALASSIADGTSNTLGFAVASAALDQARHRVVVMRTAPGALSPGQRLAGAELVTPRLTVILTDVLVESVAGTPDSFTLNFTAIDITDAATTNQAGSGICAFPDVCARGADPSGDAALILYNGHAGLGTVRFNVPDVTVIPPL